jgi:hypothetical protein
MKRGPDLSAQTPSPSKENITDRLSLAKEEYASRGWPIFPVYDPDSALLELATAQALRVEAGVS